MALQALTANGQRFNECGETQMKVFISWSGDRSRQLAEVIHWWLPHVMQFTKPYFSPSDIDKGKRWSDDISKELALYDWSDLPATVAGQGP